MILRTVAVTGLVVLAGCVAPPERVAAPETVVAPGQWRTAGDTNAVVMSWWSSFGSTQVVAVVEQAMTSNYDLQAGLARMEMAAADSRIAGADLYPQVNGFADASRTKQNFVGLPIPGSGNDPLSATFENYNLGVSTSWELDIWGRVRAGTRAAIAEMQASQADYQALQQSIAAQSVKAWLAAVELRRQIALNEQIIANYEDTVRQVERRYRRGVIDSVDYRLALTDLEAARASLSNWRAQYEAATRQLDLLLGRYPAGMLAVEVEFPDLAPAIPVGLPSELLERRPDLIAAERRLAASVSQIQQAKRALYPRISLTASGGTSTAELKDVINPDFSVWTLAANATQPLFQGGRLLAGIDMAEAVNRQAVAQYAQAILTAFTEVEIALSIDDDLAARERHLSAAAEQARGSLSRAEDRYASGLESILAVLQSQRNVFNAESTLINVQRLRLDNRVNLHLALGGGYPVDIEPEIPEDERVPTIQVSQTP